ncbi:MAG: metallophosphoesterase [Hyphomicrobiaceae bacterium]|nr:metallophosphoesterase [Hyphomicrobiaceae bacterium]
MLLGGMLGGYALAEPFRLTVTRHRLSPVGWPAGLELRVAVLADLHACDPWMTPAHVARIVAQTNALSPDLVLLLGDFVAGYRMGRFSRLVPHAAWAAELARLHAPLGRHAVLGNHDWWEEVEVQDRRKGPTRAGLALQAAGIPVYENSAVRLVKNGQAFWLAGLGDQWAFWPKVRRWRGRGSVPYDGVDDLPATLAGIDDAAPVILMAHEPDIFPSVPRRVALTVSGHTHGGQVRFLGYAPIVPSRYGRRYLHGVFVEDGRHLVVSSGLGVSGLPVRFSVPPEIVVIELGGRAG